MTDALLFIAFPYVAFALAVAVGLYRYFFDRFSYSSISSQFLENRAVFWGSVPWHYGILAILLAHLAALFFPGQWGGILASPIRLYIMEITGLALASLALVGIVILCLRRLSNVRVAAVTTTMDWVFLAALLGQVGLGLTVAFFFRWGSEWYLFTAVPWLVSLATFNPQIETLVALPLLVKLHMLGAFVLVALFPFTRLVHFVTFPITYLWRPYQVVIWNRSRQRAPERR